MTASLTEIPNRIDGAQFFAGLRRDHPVYFDEGYKMFVLSRYEDVQTALRQPNVFSVGKALFASFRFEDEVTRVLDEHGHGKLKEVLPMTDPPEHTRVRSLVNFAFSGLRVSKLQGFIERIVEAQIDKFIDAGHFEAVSQLAQPVPVTVISELLSVPLDRSADILRWTESYASCAGNRIPSAERAVEIGHDLAELQNFVVTQLDARRANPRDDLLSDLLAARAESFEPLDDKEILAIVVAFIGAGHESTTSAITSMVKRLAENPQQLRDLREAPDRDAAAKAYCEEVLRMDPPLNAIIRFVTVDTEVAGLPIPANSLVLLAGASCNRDEKVFGDDAEKFCPARPNANRHVSFGGGVHVCLGNMLARTELKIVARVLAQRIEKLSLVTSDIPVSDYGPSIMDWNYRLKKLDVEFVKRA